MRKQVPPEKTKDVLEFATKKPEARLSSIVSGLKVLSYGQSEYLRSFGLSVDSTGPVKIGGRILNPPTMIYGQGSRQPTVVSYNGGLVNILSQWYTEPSRRRMEHG